MTREFGEPEQHGEFDEGVAASKVLPADGMIGVIFEPSQTYLEWCRVTEATYCTTYEKPEATPEEIEAAGRAEQAAAHARVKGSGTRIGRWIVAGL